MKLLLIRLLFVGIVLSTLSSCKVWNSVFGPKYGCKGNGKNVGAERILSGERTPKPKKFKQDKF